MDSGAEQPYDDALQRRLYINVTTYQEAYLAYHATTDRARREGLLVVQQQALEQLYADLRQELIKLARGWSRSLMIREQLAAGNSYHDALDSLAMSVFGDIALALPGCKLKPDGDICKYLIQLARNKLCDQQHKVYGEPKGGQQHDQVREHAMWPLPATRVEGVWENCSGTDDQSYLADPEDLASVDFDTHLIQHQTNRAYLQAILDYWYNELPLEDRVIMMLRWTVDEPFSFKAIARCLGKGWTPAAARQRHHRILQRTYRYLIARGLVDPSELGACLE